MVNKLIRLKLVIIAVFFSGLILSNENVKENDERNKIDQHLKEKKSDSMERMLNNCAVHTGDEKAMEDCANNFLLFELFGEILDLAEKHLNEERYAESIEASTLYLNYNKENPYVYNLLGFANFAIGNFEEASKQFQEFNRHRPELYKIPLLFYISNLRNGNDNYNEFKALFNQGVEIAGWKSDVSTALSARLFLKKSTPKEIHKVGKKGSLEKRTILWFYVAQYELINGNKETALILLNHIYSINEEGFSDCFRRVCHYEYLLAKAERNRLREN